MASVVVATPLLSQTWPSTVLRTSRPDALTSATASLAGFGSAVATDGEHVYIARSSGDAKWTPASNDVFVFSRDAGGRWKESGAIRPRDAKPDDRFGASLAVDGDWMAVGAPGAHAVYLFERRGQQWTEAGRVVQPDTLRGTFGRTLTLRGGTLLVAAPARDSSRGAVYVSRRDSRGQWSEAVLLAAGTEPLGQFGRGLAFDGTRVLIGAPGPISVGSTQGIRQRGSVTAYRTTSGGGWIAEGQVTAPGDSVTGFGFSILLQGNEALIGAPSSSANTGWVAVFSRGGSGEWRAGQVIAPPDSAQGQLFGLSLQRAGGELLVGAPVTDRFQGAVHVFRRGGEGWTHAQTLTPPASMGRFGLFGMQLDARGSLLGVVAPAATQSEGEGYVFSRTAAGEWAYAANVQDQPVGMPAVRGGEVRCSADKASQFGCNHVDLEAFVPNTELGAGRGIGLNDIWGWTDPASKREFAMVGKMDGTAFVEVTNPAAPVVLGTLPMHQGANPGVWRDIKVYKDHAFIVADGSGEHGMQVFDLRQLLAARADTHAIFSETVHYDKVASAHNIAINEDRGFAYIVGSNGGGETCGGALHMVNIQDPLKPVFAGCFADPATGIQKTGYTHDTQCVDYKGPDTRYRGREICFNSSETAVGISDVTDKAAPKALAVAGYPNSAYTHQGWLDEAQEYFYVDDEGDEIGKLVPKTRTLVWDVRNLEEPVLVKEYLGTTSASDHNLYVKGNYVYQANYVSGLRVLDISDRANPREVGYFDTVPYGDDTPGFEGAWSTYPYFPSGTIVVSSIGQGLFVLKHRPQEATP